MQIRIQKTEAAVVCVGCTALMVGAIAFAGRIGGGIRTGLTVCGEMLIPSLFPMMVLCGFFVRCGAADAVGRLLAPVTRRLFHLPGCAGPVVLTAMIGGYPIGAQGVRTLLDRGALTRAEAAHMMRFCICAGPGFAVAFAGAGLFGSTVRGLLFYGAQVTAALALGIATRGPTPSAGKADAPHEPPAQALTGAVTAAAQSMLALCAFVLLFAGLRAGLPDLNRLPVLRRALDLLLEVTGAVQAARAMGQPTAAAFALGFGGLCVHAQLRAICPVCPRGFFLWRLLHGAWTALLFAAGNALLPASATVLPASAVPTVYASAGNGPFSAALLGMVAIFLLSLPENSFFSWKNRKKA